jgi:hypothetical protein
VAQRKQSETTTYWGYLSEVDTHPALFKEGCLGPHPSYFCVGGDFHDVAIIVEFERQLPHPNVEKHDVRMGTRPDQRK